MLNDMLNAFEIENEGAVDVYRRDADLSHSRLHVRAVVVFSRKFQATADISRCLVGQVRTSTRELCAEGRGQSIYAM